jgi:hypothetical protein
LEHQENVMLRKTLLAAMLSAAFASIAVPAYAAVIVRVAPPEPRVEVVPAPRAGYVWNGGHWEWRNQRHQWVAGNWLRERRGYRYNQPAWAETNGRWTMQRGRWDRDGDGVPNSVDRAPNNPNRN